MTASGVTATVAGVASTAQQSPTQAVEAEVAKAMQEALTARQQAQQEAAAARQEALQQAQAARQEAQNAAQEARNEIERARREIDRAIRQARREGQPGVFVPPFPGSGAPFPGSGPQIPEGAVIISVAFFVMCAVIVIGFPIARAIARRMDKRNTVAPAGDADSRARLERIEQAVDAIAVEVERISEGQRFTTKVMSDLRALPQADPSVAVPDRVAVPLSRAREAR